MFICFCYSAKTRDSFTGSSSICSLCKVKSCVSNPLFRRQSSLPNRISHPVHVKLICEKHAMHGAPFRNVLLSDSDLSKNCNDDDESFHEKYLESCDTVSKWDEKELKDINFDSDCSGSVIACPSLVDHNSSSEDLSPTKTENLLKKTRFRIDDWRRDSDQTDDMNDAIEENKSSVTKEDFNEEVADSDKPILGETLDKKEKGSDTVNPTPPNVSHSPSNTPDTPTQKRMFLKCKSQVDVDPTVTPPSALPPSDYGERTHTAVQPSPQGSKRSPFSRSLSNADVQPDERGGECLNIL